ncbi:MAG: hypothetical protein NZ879_07620, partial [Archaeoglobaceae archaeon]|nr:hypothetical protein [Archaeoglobaceae archaeon]MDW8118833.1 choice-of-anchor U domain-containing protein [Archaeoglobaceae archaeon]
MKLRLFFTFILIAVVSSSIAMVLESEEWEVGELYFPGDKVSISSSFQPEEAYIITPVGEKIALEFFKVDEKFFAEFELKDSVVLGEYRVIVDGTEKRFIVDHCDLKVDYKDGVLFISAETYYTKPKIKYALNSNISESPENISIPLFSGEYELQAECGRSIVEKKLLVEFSIEYNGTVFAILDGKAVNATLKVFADREYEFYGSFNPKELNLTNFTVFAEYEHLNAVRSFNLSIDLKEVYFPGETIILKIDFASNGKIIDPIGKIHELSFRNGTAEFRLEKNVILGEYILIVNDIEKRFFVDSYNITASFEGDFLNGEVKWYFFEPKYVVISSENETFEVILNKGRFEFQTKHDNVSIRCGNAEVFLEKSKVIHSNVRSFEYEGMIFNFSSNKGKIEKISFDGENLSLIISELGIGEEIDLEIEFPFPISDGLHVYYWKEVNGELVAVNYSISEDRKRISFKLKDGVIDEDGVANGVIVDPLKLYIPDLKVEKKIEGKKGKLKVFKNDKKFEMEVESNNSFSYLAFVDPENLPSKPAEFPYGLLKFRIEVEKGGEAEIRITYPSLEELLDDSGMVRFYKFNAEKLEWNFFD